MYNKDQLDRVLKNQKCFKSPFLVQIQERELVK